MVIVNNNSFPYFFVVIYVHISHTIKLFFRCDMYLHVVEPKTQTIAPIPHVLKVIDAKYDFLKHYYAGFAIENVVVSIIISRRLAFETANCIK